VPGLQNAVLNTGHNNDIHLITYGHTMKNIVLALLLFHASLAGASDKFEFVVLGDTAYTDTSYTDYEKLIDKINDSDPAFSIHVGDTLGYQSCTDETYDRIDGFFSRFEMPLVYTPGDNEWTDCEEPGSDARASGDWEAVANYKLSRLAELRSRYFSIDESLGKRKITQKRQSEYGKDEHKAFVENAYWIHGGVLFGTVHIVGSSDGFHPYILGQTHESVARRGANYSWIMRMADIAEEHDVKAIVLAAHGDMFERREKSPHGSPFSGTMIRGGKYGPYVGYVHAMSVLASKFARPILLVHGDHHRFVIDRPMMMKGDDDEPDKLRYQNLTRLQVFGAPELRAVKVSVNPESDSVFGFSALY
jgi:hypothetical protein